MSELPYGVDSCSSGLDLHELQKFSTLKLKGDLEIIVSPKGDIKSDISPKEVVGGSNESLYYPDEEFDQNLPEHCLL